MEPPGHAGRREAAFDRVDAVFTGRDDRTYLFSGDRFVVFDNRHRWWSEPTQPAHRLGQHPLRAGRRRVPRHRRQDLRLRAARYVRYSGDDYTRVDDRYPKAVTSFWGNVVNPITRSGHVDAALVLRSPAEVAGGPERTHTYLFSGGSTSGTGHRLRRRSTTATRATSPRR